MKFRLHFTAEWQDAAKPAYASHGITCSLLAQLYRSHLLERRMADAPAD